MLAAGLVAASRPSGRWCAVGLVAALVYLLFVAWLPERIYLAVFQTLVLGMAAFWFLGAARGSLTVRFHPVLAGVLALPLWGVLQLSFGASVYRWPTVLATLDWSVLAALTVLCFQVAAVPLWQRWFRRLWIGLGVGVTALSLLHWYTSPGLILWWQPNPYAMHAPFPLLNHTHFAALVELALGFAVWEALESGKPFQFYGWAAALMAGAVFALGSRSGSAIVAAEIVILAARHRRRSVAILLPVLVLVAAIGWQGLAARTAPRDELRPLFAQSTLNMIRSRPLTGFGLGTWSTVYPAFARVDPELFVEHAHNDWLEWAAEGGIPFAVILLSLAGWAAFRGWRDPQWLGVSAVFVQAFAEFPLHKPAMLALQFAALGWMAAAWFDDGTEILSTRPIPTK